MARPRSLLDKIGAAIGDKLTEILGTLAPRPDPIPIPVRDDRPRRR
jgi:hypothetical protein